MTYQFSTHHCILFFCALFQATRQQSQNFGCIVDDKDTHEVGLSIDYIVMGHSKILYSILFLIQEKSVCKLYKVM